MTPRKPLVVLHPGASQDSKCWPAASFAAVAAALGARFNVVLTGSPKERPLADAVVSRPARRGRAAAGRRRAAPAHRPDRRAGRAGRRRRHRRHQRSAHRLRPGDAAGRRLRQHAPRRQRAPVRPARPAVRRHRALRARATRPTARSRATPTCAASAPSRPPRCWRPWRRCSRKTMLRWARQRMNSPLRSLRLIVRLLIVRLRGQERVFLVPAKAVTRREAPPSGELIRCLICPVLSTKETHELSPAR